MFQIDVTPLQEEMIALMSSVYAFRIIRLFRSAVKMKVMKRLEKLGLIVYECFFSSFYALMMLFSAMLIYAILGMNLFGESQSVQFGDISKSYWTMFKVTNYIHIKTSSTQLPFDLHI